LHPVDERMAAERRQRIVNFNFIGETLQGERVVR
jgi:hypothetical protein